MFRSTHSKSFIVDHYRKPSDIHLHQAIFNTLPHTSIFIHPPTTMSSSTSYVGVKSELEDDLLYHTDLLQTVSQQMPEQPDLGLSLDQQLGDSQSYPHDTLQNFDQEILEQPELGQSLDQQLGDSQFYPHDTLQSFDQHLLEQPNLGSGLSQQLDGAHLHQSDVLQTVAQQIQEQPDLIPSLAQQIKPLLNESFTNPHYTPVSYIHGEADFHLKMKAYLTLCDQELDQNAIADYPSDQETQQKLVQELVAAMIYLGEDCEDAESKKSVNRLKKLSPIELDLMAWTVLLDTRDCQLGKTGIPRWGKDWVVQRCGTFGERFEHVKSALYYIKASVVSLFDYTFSKRLALNPRAEMRKIRGNKVVNRNKQNQLALAKEESGQRKTDPEVRRREKQQARTRSGQSSQTGYVSGVDVGGMGQRDMGFIEADVGVGDQLQGYRCTEHDGRGTEMLHDDFGMGQSSYGVGSIDGEIGTHDQVGDQIGDSMREEEEEDDEEMCTLPPLDQEWMQGVFEEELAKQNSFMLA